MILMNRSIVLEQILSNGIMKEKMESIFRSVDKAPAHQTIPALHLQASAIRLMSGNNDHTYKQETKMDK